MKRFLIVIAMWSAGIAGQTEVKLDNLTAKTPAGWKTQEPSSKFRQYQFTLPKADGDKEDAELYITNFGGGGLEANIGRWKGMFQPPEGKSIDDVTKVEKFKVGGADAVLVDVQGTYKTKFPPFAPNGKEIIKSNYRRVNVVLKGPEMEYFIILSGPQATIAKHEKDFQGWVKSFK